ncbi:sirohydrochlorin cobaltochelatase [Sporomusaceae bacterium FL31]|nr:sirohydrochlorin cobaltochelatase [Sporomusaceae bacterium FL31]GCE34036.1 sirohydrochlorin cobaltochelatase [Sporomusaceae bacterium]
MSIQQQVVKKAILVVSFGTTYLETLKLNIESVEDKIKAAFPDYEVRRAFTSRMVIKKLAARDGLVIDTEEQALAKLQAEGYTEVYVQPLHVVAGEEYDKVRRLVVHFAHAKAFKLIKLGRPLLYFMGQEEQPDDYLAAITAITKQFPSFNDAEALVLMGHGGVHPANAAYAALQLKLEQAGLDGVYVYTVEGFPSLENIIEKLKANQVSKVLLAPFMLVAGDHAQNDMAGDDDDSAKSQLSLAGFSVEVCLRGLGENPYIQELYVQHLRDAMAQPYGHKKH